MKYILIVCLISSVTIFPASDSPKNSPSVRRKSKKNEGLSEIKMSHSPQHSPKDKKKLMEQVSDLSREQKDLTKSNPHVLPRPTRSRSFSGGGQDSLSSISSLFSTVNPLTGLLQEEHGEMVDGLVSPRCMPASPRGCLERVASHRKLGLVAEREKRKIELENYRDQLTTEEQRLFDCFESSQFAHLEFIKQRSGLLAFLINKPTAEIVSSYMHYLLSSHERSEEKNKRLEKKLEAYQNFAERKSFSPLNQSPRSLSPSPRDDSPRTVEGLILAEQSNGKFSPRRKDAPESFEEVRDLIAKACEKAQKELELHSSVLKPVMRTADVSVAQRSRASSLSSSAASSSTP